MLCLSALTNLGAMENFLVSARKYRPATFETVVGQLHITSTLKNSIKNNQLAQAFLFCGPRGVGKTTCARILAKTINCLNLVPDQEACGTCESCISFQHGNSFNFHELDAASNNSVDDIRSLIEQVRIPPQAGKYKTYIIDEVHMLSQAAFNAFLKTLEEPPSYAIFILATTEKHKILPTILSRCQIFDFNRIRVEDIASHLTSIAIKEDIQYDSDGLHLIAQKADGGLRDALSMFDQIVSFSNKNVSYKAVIDNLNILDYDYYFKLTDALMEQRIPNTLVLFDEVLSNGFDGNHFITGLASHFRNLLVGKDAVTLKLLEVSEGIKQKYLLQANAASASFLLSALNLANQCDLHYKTSRNQRLQVELALIKMCHISSVINLASFQAKDEPSGTEGLKKKPESIAATPAELPKEIPVKEIKSVNEDTVSVTTVQEPDPEQLSTKNEGSKPVLNGSLLKASASIIPDLNTLADPNAKKKDDKPEYVEGEQTSDFTTDEFLKKWNEYAETIKIAGKINLFTIMTANAPSLLDKFKIEVQIENKIQESQLMLEKIDLLNFLRVELQNFAVDITTKQAEQNTKRKLYTSTEKYQHMAGKNPNMDEFRKKFNLGLE